MIRKEIPSSERSPFFDHFSKLHSGAMVTVRIGSCDQVVNRPLRRVVTEGSDVIVDAGDARLGRRIPHVAVVRLEQTDEGADAGLAMVSDDGTRSEIRFRSPIPPDLPDPVIE